VYGELSRVADAIDDGSLSSGAESYEAQYFIRTDKILWVDVKARQKGDQEWSHQLDAAVGDTVEIQTTFVNKTARQVDDVMVRMILPTNMEYLADFTSLFSSSYTYGVTLKDNTVATSGINIGSYLPEGNAYVRFEARVRDISLSKGLNQLVIWATVTVDGDILYHDCSAFVSKKRRTSKLYLL